MKITAIAAVINYVPNISQQVPISKAIAICFNHWQYKNKYLLTLKDLKP